METTKVLRNRLQHWWKPTGIELGLVLPNKRSPVGFHQCFNTRPACKHIRVSRADHMINSRECVADFNVDRFSILCRSHSLYHLKVLETLYIRSLQPSLCQKRDCLLGLNGIGLQPSAQTSYFPLFFLSSSPLFSGLHFLF